MTAIEVLHRLLDERGVEYTEDHGYREFFWDFGESGRARASAIGTKGLVQMIVTGITPEQAIAATLGTGTCKVDVRNGDWYCDACGEMVGTCDPASELFIDGNAIDMWKYCPFCGRRIVQ